MSYKIQKPIDLSSFGGRLLHLMVNKQENNLHICDTAPKLAALLLEAKLIKVNHRSRIKDEFFDDKDLAKKAKESVIKQIQKHINIDDNDTRTVSGEYLMAYCTFFNCSADYLLGFTPIQTRDITTKQICKKTGLSEQAVTNLCGGTEPDCITDLARQCWSYLLESELFYTLPEDFYSAEKEAKESIKHVAAIDAINEIISKTDPSSIKYYIHEAKIKPITKGIESHDFAYYGILNKLSQDTAKRLSRILQQKLKTQDYYQIIYNKALRQYGGPEYSHIPKDPKEDGMDFNMHFIF